MKLRTLLLVAVCLVPLGANAQRERTDSPFGGVFKVDGKHQQLWISHDKLGKQTVVCNVNRTPVCSISSIDAVNVLPIGNDARLLVQRSHKDFAICDFTGSALTLSCAPTNINDHLTTVASQSDQKIKFLVTSNGGVCGFEEKSGLRCSGVQRPGATTDAHFGAFSQPSSRADEVLFIREDSPIICASDGRLGCKSVEGLRPLAAGTEVVVTRVRGSKRSVLLGFNGGILTTCYPYGSNASKVTFTCEEISIRDGESMSMRFIRHREWRFGDTTHFFVIPALEPSTTTRSIAQSNGSRDRLLASPSKQALEAANLTVNRVLREKVRYIAELQGETFDYVAQSDGEESDDWRLVSAGDGPLPYEQTVDIHETKIWKFYDGNLSLLYQAEFYSDAFNFYPVTPNYFLSPPLPTCSERFATCDRDYNRRGDMCDIQKALNNGSTFLASAATALVSGAGAAFMVVRSGGGIPASYAATSVIGLTGSVYGSGLLLTNQVYDACKAGASSMRQQCNGNC